MAVIINDFEIAVEASPPPPPAEGGSASGEGASARPATMQDVVSAVEWQRRRLSRVDGT